MADHDIEEKIKIMGDLETAMRFADKDYERWLREKNSREEVFLTIVNDKLYINKYVIIREEYFKDLTGAELYSRYHER